MTTYTFSLEDEKALILQQKCEELGVTVQEAFENFANHLDNFVKLFKSSPSTFSKMKKRICLWKGYLAFRSLKRQAKKNGLCNMTLDQINAEIAQTRAEN